MGRKGSGVEVRERSIRLAFVLDGGMRRETLMLNGKPMPPTPANVKYAHRLAAEIRERIRHGTFSVAEYFQASGAGAGTLTVGDQLDAWLAAQRVEASTRTGYESIVRFWKATPTSDQDPAPFGGRPLRALKPSHIMAAIAARPDLSGKTINNRMGALRNALSLAVVDKLLLENPAAPVARAKHQKAPVEPFTADEVARILAMAERQYAGPLADTVAFWLRTGLRTSELFGLRWSAVDMVRRVAVIHEARVQGVEKDTTKTGVVREVRLDDRALAALTRQKARTLLAGQHVFVDPLSGEAWTNTMAFSRRIWVPLLKRAGIVYRRPYNMRHTRATEMLMAGVNPAFAAKQLGHAVEVFLTVYAKWLPGEADDAEMAKLDSSPVPPRETGSGS